MGKEKVKSKLEDAVKNYDFLKELFPEFEFFVERYLELEKCLKDGDSLDIKVETYGHVGSIRARTPEINVYFNQKGKQPRRIFVYNWQGAHDFAWNNDLDNYFSLK